MTYVPQIHVSLYDRTNTVQVADLEFAFNVQWQEAINDVGMGKFTLALTDSDVALLQRGQHVRCSVYSASHVFTWRVELIEYTRIISDEEHGQIVDVSGRGHSARLGDSKIYPPLGITQVPAVETRSQSFASPEFDDSSWPAPVEVAYFGDLNTWWTGLFDDVLTPAPFGWPTLPFATVWIWSESSGNDTPAGICYFRRQFTLDADVLDMTIIATGDNYWTLYLDGAALLGDNTNPEAWMEHRRVQLDLKAGVHTFAAVVNNWRQSPAGFLCSVYTETNITCVDQPPVWNEVTETWDAVDPICTDAGPHPYIVSDSNWKCLGYPLKEPGHSPGEVILQLLAESQARGQLTDVQANFTATTDTGGAEWDTMGEIGFSIGDSILDALNFLATGGWCDWYLHPVPMVGKMILSMWAGETRGFANQSVVFAAGVNIVDISHSQPGRVVNRLLVKYADGLFVLDHAPSQASMGEIVEEYLTLDAANRQEADRQAIRALSVAVSEEPAITITLECVGLDRPYVDWWLGNFIVAPDETGNLMWYRILGVTITEDDMGDATVQVELNRRVFNLEKQRTNLFQTLGSNVIGPLPASDLVPAYIAAGD